MSGLDIGELSKALRNGEPAIVVRDHHVDLGFFEIDPCNMKADDPEIVVRRFQEQQDLLANYPPESSAANGLGPRHSRYNDNGIRGSTPSGCRGPAAGVETVRTISRAGLKSTCGKKTPMAEPLLIRNVLPLQNGAFSHEPTDVLVAQTESSKPLLPEARLRPTARNLTSRAHFSPKAGWTCTPTSTMEPPTSRCVRNKSG